MGTKLSSQRLTKEKPEHEKQSQLRRSSSRSSSFINSINNKKKKLFSFSDNKYNNNLRDNDKNDKKHNINGNRIEKNYYTYPLDTYQQLHHHDKMNLKFRDT